MRFISKNANLRIILRPGLPANHLSGVLAVPTVFVRFQNGLAEVKDPDMIAQMKNHPGFNADYICAEDDTPDPYASTRQDNEPPHAIAQIEYGHVGKIIGTPIKKVLPPEIQQMIQDQARELAKSMLPEMIKGLMEAGALKAGEAKKEEVSEIKNKSAKKPFCGSCSSKGGMHKKDCPMKQLQEAPEAAVEAPEAVSADAGNA
jgi:hypothetical protein